MASIVLWVTIFVIAANAFVFRLDIWSVVYRGWYTNDGHPFKVKDAFKLFVPRKKAARS